VRVVVLAVGKVRDPSLRALLDDYFGRIRRFVPCDEVEVSDDAALARAWPRSPSIVACEVRGERMTSEAFARRLESWGSTGKGIVTFVIGGAEGIPAERSRSADAALSLSTFTLPHRLARVILAEQIYRAFTIMRGQPYARE
jgi:23S rRNA (pseudouridine1915-N3)-methyltransferase